MLTVLYSHSDLVNNPGIIKTPYDSLVVGKDTESFTFTCFLIFFFTIFSATIDLSTKLLVDIPKRNPLKSKYKFREVKFTMNRIFFIWFVLDKRSL